MNPRFQAVIEGRPSQVPPVWMMRQAGRYHQHYQKLKEKHSFMELCKEPELAAEVALGPVLDFDFDVSILFSDLLFPLEALGMGLEYSPGPKLGWHLSQERLKDLNTIEEALPQLEFQKKAMELTRERLPADKSLVGFVGSPWTLFCYAVMGSHAGHMIEVKKDRELFDAFSELMLELLCGNIALQFEGGAELVMIFDTAAGELSPTCFNEWVVPKLKRLAEQFPKKLVYYSKHTNPGYFTDPVFKEGFLGLGFDHRNDLPEVLRGQEFSLVQGNFDQTLLFLDENEFRKELDAFLKPFGDLCLSDRKAWVCGLGHGVLPKTPEANVRYFVQRVRQFFGGD